MTQIWPGFGVAPVPTVVSMICKPEAVVMVFPAVWAEAPDGARRRAPAMAMAMAIGKLRNWKRRILLASLLTGREVACAGRLCSIAERATVLARIGAAGERALVPVDPDRLTAAERGDYAGGLMPELLQALDDIAGHAVLELIDAFVMQATRHIDRLLHVATIVEHVGQHVNLPDRLILPAHHAEWHQRPAALGDKAWNDRVQRPLAGRDAVGMAGLDAETGAAILQQDAGLVGDDRRTEGMRDRIDERTDVAVLVHHGDVDRRRIHRRRHFRQVEQPVHPDLAGVLLGELRQDPGHIDLDEGGIADVLLAHHVGDPRGFGFEMKPLHAHRREFR